MASLQAKLFTVMLEHIEETTGRPWLYVDANYFPAELQARYKGVPSIPLKVHRSALGAGGIVVSDTGICFVTRLGGVERVFNLLWSEFTLSTEMHDVDLLPISVFTTHEDIVDAIKFKDLVDAEPEAEVVQKPKKPSLRLV